jgi:hypothetical protein
MKAELGAGGGQSAGELNSGEGGAGSGASA